MTRTVLVAVGLAAITFAAGSAEAKPTPVKVKKVTCEYVVNGAVMPLKGNRYEGGKVRCRAQLAVPATFEEPSLAIQLSLHQPGEQGGPPVTAKASVTAQVWPGFKHAVEAEVALPDNLNGCMPFQLEMAVGSIAKKVTAQATCPD